MQFNRITNGNQSPSQGLRVTDIGSLNADPEEDEHTLEVTADMTVNLV